MGRGVFYFPVKFDSLSSEPISFLCWLIIKKKSENPHAQQGLNVFTLIAQSRGLREKVQLWAVAAEPASGLHDNHLIQITPEKNGITESWEPQTPPSVFQTVLCYRACNLWHLAVFLILWEEKKEKTDNRKCHSWPAAGRYLWLNYCLFKILKLCLYDWRARIWHVYKQMDLLITLMVYQCGQLLLQSYFKAFT